MQTQKPNMFVTHRQAGVGAFCSQCQPEDNKYRRLIFSPHCMVVEITNDNGQFEIFLCDDCIKGAQAEAKKTGEFRFILSTKKVRDRSGELHPDGRTPTDWYPPTA